MVERGGMSLSFHCHTLTHTDTHAHTNTAKQRDETVPTTCRNEGTRRTKPDTRVWTENSRKEQQGDKRRNGGWLHFGVLCAVFRGFLWMKSAVYSVENMCRKCVNESAKQRREEVGSGRQ